ncbi:MAG: hypothetical protein AAFR96_10655 [Planctomycetota bacterium]
MLSFALVSALPFAGGCNIVAPLFFLVAGPDTYEAEHKLDDERATVVFIDDPRSRVPRRALRLEMLKAVEESLLSRGLVDTLLDGQAAMRVSDGDSTGGRMSITELGRTIGADIVVWVTVDEFVRPGVSGDTQPSASIRVRVVDAESNEVQFPADPAGRPLRVSDAFRRGAVANAAGARSAAELAIASKAGGAAAQLFYEYPVTRRIADRGP